MRRTRAPSQGFKQVTVRKDAKPFPEAARSTSELLSLLSSPEVLDASVHVEATASADIFDSESLPLENDAHPPINDCSTSSKKKRYNVVWGKQTKRKHKTWEGDGVLEIHNDTAILKDLNGVILGRSSKLKDLEEGSRAFVGSKEIEIIDVLENGENQQICPAIVKKPDVERLEQPKITKPNLSSSNFSMKRSVKRFKTNGEFAVPFQNESKDMLTMPRPDYAHQWKYNPDKLPVNDVKLDLFLSRVLRQHQQEGLLFLYSCVTGIRDVKYNGAILADEMGLGKTLQCIALTWLLLKTGPYGGLPLIRRVLVVTPSSLATNWYKEFKRWLGFERLHPFIIDKNQKPAEFANLPASSNRPVMIISYEMLVRHYEDIKNIKFQLLICDEGHRLKNPEIQTSQLLSQLNIQRRIILTGTPVQNNLQEFFALIDFVNPGILGNYYEFKTYFEAPIVAFNQSDCSNITKETGGQRAAELNHRTSCFILRRTQSVIDQYLPSKMECIIFCSPTTLQVNLYDAVVSYWSNRICDGAAKVPALSIITTLKKICNNPELVKTAAAVEEIDEFAEDIDDFGSYAEDLLNHLQPIFGCSSPGNLKAECSSKMIVLEHFLLSLAKINEKAVLISYSTRTLDLMQDMCCKNNFCFLRLDGHTPAIARSEAVDKFNSPHSKYFVFLLSAKAGGVGLNLTGASRLVLFDLDWNPASDLQAMSRIWRDGQKKSVYIYRFLTTGSIEEKIYQRQISKTFLSDAVVDTTSASNIPLSIEELKDLFTFRPDCESHTHELLMCECNGCGIPETAIKEEEDTNEERPYQLSISKNSTSRSISKISELIKWEHYSIPLAEDVLEELCLQSVSDRISFIFRNKYSS